MWTFLGASHLFATQPGLGRVVFSCRSSVSSRRAAPPSDGSGRVEPVPRVVRGGRRRGHEAYDRSGDVHCRSRDARSPPGNSRPAGFRRRRLLWRDGHHVQARLRGGLYLCAGGGEPSVVRLPVLRTCNGRKAGARRAFGPSYGHAGAQAHGARRPHLHHLDPVLLRHERASRARGAHAAVPVHLDGARLADHHDAAGAQAPRGRLGRGHRVRHRVRKRRLQDGARRLRPRRPRLRPRRGRDL